jgi:uncharacterized membrane protein YhaH (DUF805 family)
MREDWPILIATVVFAFAIVAVTGTALALHLKPLNGSTRSGQQKIGRVRNWISGLLTSAIFGALAGVFLSLLGFWIVPKYWGALICAV